MIFMVNDEGFFVCVGNEIIYVVGKNLKVKCDGNVVIYVLVNDVSVNIVIVGVGNVVIIVIILLLVEDGVIEVKFIDVVGKVICVINVVVGVKDIDVVNVS